MHNVLKNAILVVQRLNDLTFQTPVAINQSPSLREKAILLVKLMQYFEKRFPDDMDLNAQYLELVNII